MLRKIALTCASAALAMGMSSTAYSQARATAHRDVDLQIGGGYAFTAPSDFSPETYKGPYFYFDYDFRYHWGVEGSFHQVNSPSPAGQYERSYEAGARYILHFQALKPYARVTYGRMVVNYPNHLANLAFNMIGFGGGIDIPVHRHVNVRGDFQHQQLFGFKPNGLTPNLVSFGAAYHF